MGGLIGRVAQPPSSISSAIPSKDQRRNPAIVSPEQVRFVRSNRAGGSRHESGTLCYFAGSGNDLTQVRIDDVRTTGLPRFLDLAWIVDRKGPTLPDLPPMTLPADRLRRSDVAYEETGVGEELTGPKVDIVFR